MGLYRYIKVRASHALFSNHDCVFVPLSIRGWHKIAPYNFKLKLFFFSQARMETTFGTSAFSPVTTITRGNSILWCWFKLKFFNLLVYISNSLTDVINWALHYCGQTNKIWAVTKGGFPSDATGHMNFLAVPFHPPPLPLLSSGWSRPSDKGGGGSHPGPEITGGPSLQKNFFSALV